MILTTVIRRTYMKAKLDYYKIFYETAKYSSFSIAAQHLYISQSAISQCIRQLESELNAQLFTRSRKGVVLTKEGQVLFAKVESAIQAIEQGEALLQKLQHLETGELIIAAGDTITSHYLLPYLEQFHETYPNIRIEMANSYSYHMIELVREGRADLAFVNLPVADEEVIIEPCLEIHDVFVCGAGVNLKKEYTWAEMAEQPLILLEKNSSSRRFLEKTFGEKEITLNPQIEIAAHDLLIRFASINLGVSCVVEEFSKESLEQGIILPMNLVPPLPARSIGCAYMRNSPLSKAAQTFLDLIKHHPTVKNKTDIYKV